MKKFLSVALFSVFSLAFSQKDVKPAVATNDVLPVRGFCIASPLPGDVDRFVRFINEELAPRQVNTLVMRIEYNYRFEKHPELCDSLTLSKSDVKKLVAACKKNNIKLIPLIDMLGHQSWAGTIGSLLKAYPQFDETPQVRIPEKYVWPNADGLYCKSYCPLHPDVHKIVFDIIDEICDVFESDTFHAGMDEVFYIGEAQCPRCSGHDKSELFAGEVKTLRDHLAVNGRKLWIWGDRLLEGKISGLGEWEASYNDTYRAIDMIPKDVVICDWHYDRPDPTPVYFAMKGLSVITCPWNNPSSAVQQVRDMVRFRKYATEDMKGRYLGMMHTVWTGSARFLDDYYGKSKEKEKNSQIECMKAMLNEIQKNQ